MEVPVKLTDEDIQKIALSVVKELKKNTIDIKTHTVKEVAVILNCTTITVLSYIKSGILKATRKGKSFIITQQSIEEFLTK